MASSVAPRSPQGDRSGCRRADFRPGEYAIDSYLQAGTGRANLNAIGANPLEKSCGAAQLTEGSGVSMTACVGLLGEPGTGTRSGEGTDVGGLSGSLSFESETRHTGCFVFAQAF